MLHCGLVRPMSNNHGQANHQRGYRAARSEETGCVPDVDGKKVRAEKIVPHAKRYILETIDNPKASYDATIWHSPGYTLVLSWLSQKWLKYCQKLAPTVLKDVDLHLPKDQRKLCLDWAADELTRQITRRRQRFH